ncbi:MAG: hypothetical protein ACE15B_22105 [Bryobacteraceae bacterium]
MMSPADGSRLFLQLKLEGQAQVQVRNAFRVHLDAAGRLIIYDGRNRITDSFQPGQAAVLRIWCPQPTTMQ